MRIAYIVSGHFGPASGAGLTVWSLCKNIPSSHRVRVYANSWDPVLPPHVEIHPLFPRGNWPANFFFPLRILLNYLSVGRLCRRLEGENDILHLYNGLAASKRLLISQLMCQKAVMTERKKESWRGWLSQQTPKHRLLLGQEDRVYRNRLYRKIVPASQFEKRQILSHYPVPSDDIIPVYGGVDFAHYNPPDRTQRRNFLRDKHGLGPDNPVALFVGYDFRRKGLPYAIRAMPLVDRRVRLLAVGGTGGLRECRELAKRLGVERRVIFTGPVYRDTADYFYAGDFFVFPTLFDPFGTAALEAMAAGLPVITSERVGVAELFTPGREGFLLRDPTDAGEIARGMNLLSDRERMAEMGRAGRKTASRHTWKKRAEELVEIYAKILSNG